jgi:Tfp pilus assembly protein PilN
MCILFQDDVVDTVFIDRTMLGAQVKFMERLPRDENIFDAVADLMKSTEKTPTRVTLCIPRGNAIQRTLRYPAAVKDDIGNMIQFEAARHVPLPEEDRLIAWSSVDSPDGNQVVLNLVGARKAEVWDIIDRFEEAGVPVDEAAPFSALATSALGDAPTLLVLVDARHIELCLYGQGMLQDSQVIGRDAPGFSEDRVVIAARQIVAKHKDWLGDEGIGRILVGGPEKITDNLEKDLGAVFGLHIHPLKAPAEVLAVLAEEEDPLSEALLVASVGMLLTLNLIEDKQRKVPISKRTIVISSLCLLLGIELLTAHAFKTGAPALQRRKVAREITAMRKDTYAIQKMKDKNRVFRKQCYQLEQACGSRASSMEILKVVSDTLPEDTYLRDISCNQEEIRLKGSSKVPAKLPELVMTMPFVNTISTSEIGSERNGYYEFNLRASLRR